MLTEEMKLEAVVVTVVRADEHELRSALARKVHITALQVNSRPPHSSLRGMCSCHGIKWDGLETTYYTLSNSGAIKV